MKLVFDIGGTHMRSAFLSADGALDTPVVDETPADFGEGSAQLADMLKTAARGRAFEAIVGGVAGVIKAGKIIHSPNLSGWDSGDLRTVLVGAFPNLPIAVANDASMAALGEAVFGAGKGMRIVSYLTISTGIGGARVVGGRLDSYRDGFEPGQQILDIARGLTFEHLASGSAIKKEYGRAYRDLSADEMDKLVEYLAVGAHNTIVHWSPDVLVLGGSVIADVPELVSKTETKLHSIMKIFTSLPMIRPAALGDLSGLWGATVFEPAP